MSPAKLKPFMHISLSSTVDDPRVRRRMFGRGQTLLDHETYAGRCSESTFICAVCVIIFLEPGSKSVLLVDTRWPLSFSAQFFVGRHLATFTI